MAVVQGFEELTAAESVAKWAHANPSLPRVIGIDVGQDKLAVWFGAPSANYRADTLGGALFHYFAWVLIRCSATRTNAQARVLVLRGLEAYRDSVFALASDVVIEKQHKLNGRMKSLAGAIRDWVRTKVPNGERMRIVEREARHKFASLPGLPCPMPQKYEARKQATLTHIGSQVRTAGERWHRFLNTWIEAGDDLADAACIAQDWMVSRYQLTLFSTARLSAITTTLATRRRNNTWRRTTTTRRRRPTHSAVESSHDDDDDDSDDDDDEPSNDDEYHKQVCSSIESSPVAVVADNNFLEIVTNSELGAALLDSRGQ